MDNDAINSKKGTKWKVGDDLTLQIEGHASLECKGARAGVCAALKTSTATCALQHAMPPFTAKSQIPRTVNMLKQRVALIVMAHPTLASDFEYCADCFEGLPLLIFLHSRSTCTLVH